MKKVLVFGMTENPGGVESVIMNYYRHINREKVQFDFLCNCPNIAYEEEIKSLGGKVYKITARKENYWKFKKELKLFMRKNASAYDVLWVNICSLVNIDYLIEAKKCGISKRIIHCHNSENDAGKIKGIIHAINKTRISHFATDFWSCSETASSWFYSKKILAGKKYKVIPNAIDVKKFERNDYIRMSIKEKMGLKGKKVIGHVGRFHFQKNHKFLISVFERVIKKNDNYRLLLVGQGELETEIKDLVREKGLLDKVIFCGVRNDMDRIYQVMDIFVLPSLFEGLAVVALEAQACLLPCLFADTLPQQAKINSNVKFLPLEKGESAWADMIDYMVNNPQKVENQMLESNYNIETQVNNFEKSLFE